MKLALALAVALLSVSAKGASFSTQCSPDTINVICPQTITANSTVTWTAPHIHNASVTVNSSMTASAFFGDGSALTGITSGITGSGTVDTIPVWTGAGSVGDSIVKQSGSEVIFNVLRANSGAVLSINGDATTSGGGLVEIKAGTSPGGAPQGVDITASAGSGGPGPASGGGSVVISGGAGQNSAGNVSVSAGNASVATGGNVNITAGNSGSGSGGNIVLTPGSGDSPGVVSVPGTVSASFFSGDGSAITGVPGPPGVTNTRTLEDAAVIVALDWQNRIAADTGGATRLAWTTTGVDVTGVLGVSGQTLIADGTAALPGLAFTSFSSFGIFKTGVNIGFSTLGTEKARLTDMGKFGIGTTSPQTLLDVEGTASFGSVGKTTVTADGYIHAPDGSAATPSIAFGGFSSFGLFRAGVSIGFATVGTEKARLTDMGRFGLGTTSPQALLDVEGTASFGSVGKTTVTADGYIHAPDGSAATPSYSFGSFSSFGFFKTGLNIGVATVGSEIARFTDNGELGLGTTSPTEILDVVGNIKASGTVAAGSGTNTVYYCSGATDPAQNDVLVRTVANAANNCAGGSLIATSLRVD